jgi:hypothetical protein
MAPAWSPAFAAYRRTGSSVGSVLSCPAGVSLGEGEEAGVGFPLPPAQADHRRCRVRAIIAVSKSGICD